MHIRSFGYIAADQSQMTKPEGGGAHPYQEILYIGDGMAELEWLTYRWKVRGPALFLLPAGSPHWVKALDSKFRCWYVELSLPDQDFLTRDTLLSWNQLQTNTRLLHTEGYLLWQSLDIFGMLLAEQQHLERSEVDRHNGLLSVLQSDILKLLQLAAYLERKLSEPMEPAKGHNLKRDPNEHVVQNIMKYMEVHYSRAVTLDMLSHTFHLDRSYLTRLFRKHTGMTPFSYLNNLRLEAAAHYLTSTTVSIVQIAGLTGYQSLHYFSRAFKKAYGCSPSAWRSRT